MGRIDLAGFMERLRKSWPIALLAFMIGSAPSWIPIIKDVLNPRYHVEILAINNEPFDLIACSQPIKKGVRDSDCFIMPDIKCAVHIGVTNVSDSQRTIDSYSLSPILSQTEPRIVPFVGGRGRSLGMFWYVSRREEMTEKSDMRMAEALGDNFFDNEVHKPLSRDATITGWVFFFADKDSNGGDGQPNSVGRFQLEIHDTRGDVTAFTLEGTKEDQMSSSLGGGVVGSVKVYSVRDLAPPG